MPTSSRIFYRITAIGFLVLILAFGFVQAARAEGIIYGASVPSGTEVDNDIVLYGPTVTIDGTVLGDVVAIGKDVVVNGVVEGSLYTVGENITIHGEIAGSVYAASVFFDLGETGRLDRNLYYLGLSLTTMPGSVIARDLYTICLGFTSGGELGRDLKAIIGPVEIIQKIIEFFNQQFRNPGSSWAPGLPGTLPSIARASRLDQDPSLVILGPDPAHGLMPASLELRPAAAQSEKPVTQTSAQLYDFGVWLLGRLKSFVTLFLVGLIMVWLLPKPTRRWSEQAQKRPARSLGFGFMALVTGLVGAFLLAVAILILSLALGAFTLYDLAFIVASLGFASLGLAFAVFWMLVVYISKALVAYVIGVVILQRFAPKAAENKIWPLALGLLIYVLLSGIPYFGFIFAILAMLLGLGAIWLGSITQPAKGDESEPEITATAETEGEASIEETEAEAEGEVLVAEQPPAEASPAPAGDDASQAEEGPASGS
jgi:cytoskeletal protein CcmA (bactofilin family)